MISNKFEELLSLYKKGHIKDSDIDDLIRLSKDNREDEIENIISEIDWLLADEGLQTRRYKDYSEILMISYVDLKDNTFNWEILSMVYGTLEETQYFNMDTFIVGSEQNKPVILIKLL